MIRAVLFDLDGTLYDRDAAIIRTAELQYAAFRHDLAHVQESDFIERLVTLDGHGHKRTPRLHHQLAVDLGFSEHVADRLETFFRSNYPQSCQVTEDTLHTLATLRSRGIRLGIITNGPTQWQGLKIEVLGIAPLFDAIVISGSEGIEKPDPRIFALALERCGAVATESMFVGDHPEADVQGARGAGLTPVWKRMEYWDVPVDVARIDVLSELLNLHPLLR